MKLFLLRSAEATGGKKDSKRKLTAGGLNSLGKIAGFLSKKDLNEISEIRHSPFVRAVQTAKQFKKLSAIKAKPREVPLLEPLADFRILADFIDSSEESLLLVGHQPSLSMLASYLLTKESDADLIDLKPGGMICLEKNSSSEANSSPMTTWQQSWLVAPGMLKKK